MKLKLGSIALCLAIGFSSHAKESITATVGIVESMDELGDLYSAYQKTYLPIAPPSLEIFLQPIGNVVPIDCWNFPRQFIKNMVGSMDPLTGCPLYTVYAFEDATSREIVFLNLDSVEIGRVVRPKSYDPFAWVVSTYSTSLTTDLMALYDPARLAAEYTLIPSEYYSNYLSAIEAQHAMAAMPMMMAMEGENTNVVVGMQAVTNGLVELNLTLPNTFGNHVEIFSRDYLMYPELYPWQIAKSWLPTYGNTSVAWIDPDSGNKNARFYIISDADIDTDGDGYSDNRERYISKTDPDTFDIVDTDLDGMHDWYETKLFGTLDQTGTNDFDGDGLLNNEEMVFKTSGTGSPSVTMTSDPSLGDTDGDGIGDGEDSGVEYYDEQKGLWIGLATGTTLHVPLHGEPRFYNSIFDDNNGMGGNHDFWWIEDDQGGLLTDLEFGDSAYFTFPSPFTEIGNYFLVYYKYISGDPGEEVITRFNITTYDFDLITPFNHYPFINPILSGDGQNQFVYDNGALDIRVKAQITPSDMASTVSSLGKFSIINMGGNKPTGNLDAPTVNGGFLEATATYMPTNNSAFGEKIVTWGTWCYFNAQPFAGIRLFYEPLATAPGGKKCWYTYYKDGVINALSRFAAVDGSDPILEQEEGETVYGVYDTDLREGTYYYYIGANEQLAINQDVFSVLSEAADTVAHEIAHYDLCHEVNDAYIAIYQSFVSGQITLGQMINQIAAVDSDSDWVIDTNDPNIGADDQEELASQAGLLHWLDYVDNIEGDWTIGGYHGGL
ncbi:MAG: hypothetical protein K9M54_01420 [Kiritimatiellales bacterium]|nr:hypothetical protein [Kiritimatiellales bacterium]MCF7863692.1 hypothetical protein [Kiritimatiellales bacterium]